MTRNRNSDRNISGFVREGFEPLRAAFGEALGRRPGFGAALCVYAEGVPCVDLCGGPGYPDDGIQIVFSVTKGATAIVALLLEQRGVLDLDEPVASLWPEFGHHRKSKIPVRWLLSHRAGLPTVNRHLSIDDLLAERIYLEELERQIPYWEPGTAHGYHPISMGALVGEVVLRATGRSLGRFFSDEIARPLEIDFFIGLPDDQQSRVVPLRMTPKGARRSDPLPPNRR